MKMSTMASTGTKPCSWACCVAIALGLCMPGAVAAEAKGLTGSLRAVTAVNPAARAFAAKIAPVYQSYGSAFSKTDWYHMLTPLVNTLSRAGVAGHEDWFEDVWAGVDDDNFPLHLGKHSITNTRYKEWWYFDAFTDDGLVICGGIVLSLVKPYSFLWVFDPETNQFLNEIDEDGEVFVNTFGKDDLDLHAGAIQVHGSYEDGFVLEFEGATMIGRIEYGVPVFSGRGEEHIGHDKTWVAIYQVPQMETSGELVSKQSGKRFSMLGQGYHDHQWGIYNRYTKWNWFSVKFNNGWVASFFKSRYGRDEADQLRRGWLHRPGQGYTYFDEDRIQIDRVGTTDAWTVTATGQGNSIQINATARGRHFKNKSLQIVGVPVGECHYTQYPLLAEGVFVDATQAHTELSADVGIIETDFEAIW